MVFAAKGIYFFVLRCGKPKQREKKKIPINVYKIKIKEIPLPPKGSRKNRRNVKNVHEEKGKEFIFFVYMFVAWN